MAGILKTLTPDNRGAGYAVSGSIDFNHNNSHITVKQNVGAIPAQTVLGKQQLGTPTVAVGAAVSGVGGTPGNGVVTATADAGAPEGDYRIRFTTAGATAKFIVTRPNGDVDHVGAVGTPTTAGKLNVTAADGAADFAVDDVIDVNVAYDFTDDSNVVWAPHDPDATNGLEIAAGISWDDIPANASATQRAAATVRGPVNFNANLVNFPHVGITAAERGKAIAELEKLGIILTY